AIATSSAGEHDARAIVVALPDVPLVVRGDRLRLAQVFCNLIHNARKFTANGARIDVAVAREGAEAVIRVRDEGVGIPLDKLGAVFEMFTQIGSPGGPSSGLGIGLALARRIVELHGGTIE